MSATLLLVTGTLAGLHAATWGAFKDSPYEGFRATRFLRSIAVGAACAALLSGWQAVDDSGLLVVLGV